MNLTSQSALYLNNEVIKNGYASANGGTKSCMVLLEWNGYINEGDYIEFKANTSNTNYQPQDVIIIRATQNT